MRTLAVLAATISLLPACRPADAGLVDTRRLAMGAELRVAVWTTDQPGATRAIESVFAEFERLDGILSVWREGSDVQRLNAAAGQGPVPVGPDTRAVLGAAAEASRRTQGKFDVTFGVLADIWKFDHDQDDRVPTDAEIAARLPFVDFSAVEVDETARTARIARPGVRLHLGGIGKGYAVDKAAAILRAAGFRDFLIQSGGDLYAGGRRGDRAWRVGVNDPRGGGGDSFASVEIRDQAFSTSGDYERFFLKSGVRYHHLIDPDTGRPAAGCRSVTILAPSALMADWLSTGVFILGPVDGMALVEALPDVEAVIVTSTNAVAVSSGLKDRLRIERQPTP